MSDLEKAKPVLMFFSNWPDTRYIDMAQEITQGIGWRTESYDQETYALLDLADDPNRFNSMGLALQPGTIPAKNAISGRGFAGKQLLEVGRDLHLPRALITKQTALARREFRVSENDTIINGELKLRATGKRLSQWLLSLTAKP